MNKEKLERLKETLSIPSYTGHEERVVEFVLNICEEEGYNYQVDKHNNVYITKGEAEYFPCFVAHTDTVHYDHKDLIKNGGFKVIEEDYHELQGDILKAYDPETYEQTGTGGDDLCGVFLCMEMLRELDNVKVALFVSEENGCNGSKHADSEFFSNVGYAIQYDSPKGDSMSYTLMGLNLFEQEGDFIKEVGPMIVGRGIESWERHPYTDVWMLKEKFDFSCLNLAAGYYLYHTSAEYVSIDDVQNSFELGLEIVEKLGENKSSHNVSSKRNFLYG